MSSPIRKVSSGGVIYHNGKVLVIHWLSQKTIELPKGSVEPGETLEQTCIRELREETGYDVKVIAPLNTYRHVFDWHDGNTYDKTIHYFLCELAHPTKHKPKRTAVEDFRNQWVPIGQVEAKLTHEDSQEAVREAVRFLQEGI